MATKTDKSLLFDINGKLPQMGQRAHETIKDKYSKEDSSDFEFIIDILKKKLE